MEALRELTAYAVLIVGSVLAVIALLPDTAGNALGAVAVAAATTALIAVLAKP